MPLDQQAKKELILLGRVIDSDNREVELLLNRAGRNNFGLQTIQGTSFVALNYVHPNPEMWKITTDWFMDPLGLLLHLSITERYIEISHYDHGFSYFSL